MRKVMLGCSGLVYIPKSLPDQVFHRPVIFFRFRAKHRSFHTYSSVPNDLLRQIPPGLIVLQNHRENNCTQPNTVPAAHTFSRLQYSTATKTPFTLFTAQGGQMLH
jgi:hypothetical protein